MMSKRKPRYVVWDGRREGIYRQNEWPDCMVTYDMGLISVQAIRKVLIAKGVVPSVVFACKSGQTAMEGRYNSIFTHCWDTIWKHNPTITLRQQVSLTNRLIAKRGFSQRCETVCRADLLDRRLWAKPPDAAHCLMVFDMCRTR